MSVQATPPPKVMGVRHVVPALLEPIPKAVFGMLKLSMIMLEVPAFVSVTRKLVGIPTRVGIKFTGFGETCSPAPFPVTGIVIV
jgi:hypothetical protein